MGRAEGASREFSSSMSAFAVATGEQRSKLVGWDDVRKERPFRRIHDGRLDASTVTELAVVEASGQEATHRWQTVSAAFAFAPHSLGHTRFRRCRCWGIVACLIQKLREYAAAILRLWPPSVVGVNPMPTVHVSVGACGVWRVAILEGCRTQSVHLSW